MKKKKSDNQKSEQQCPGMSDSDKKDTRKEISEKGVKNEKKAKEKRNQR